MRGHLALVLLGSLISRTVSGGDLEPVRVGRYSAIVPGPCRRPQKQQGEQDPMPEGSCAKLAEAEVTDQEAEPRTGEPRARHQRP
jgi:hypothetical protein